MKYIPVVGDVVYIVYIVGRVDGLGQLVSHQFFPFSRDKQLCKIVPNF